ncbi:phosphotransferase enzyme family protein [Dongia soli]|uniref:Phosphotransferase enzyme family protein n=1 Tax=Dongia soli TaxID=600628 RepID=A0ABU5EGL6_9PROT|nr:phosphotransferase enzyme family protein [Dongia soli]MDY0885568.1 phosphotransferase enzyme family protein [Dongia soli]
MSADAVMTVEAFLAKLGRLAEQALSRYGFSPDATATLINYSENATYLVEDPVQGKQSILRIHRRGYHNEAAIRSELQWIDALRKEEGVITAAPIPASDGTLIQRLANDELPEPRHAVMFTYLTGREPSEDDLLGPFERLGAVSAHMHRHSRNWRLPNGFIRQRWDHHGALGALSIWGHWQNGMGMTPAYLKLFERLSETIRKRLDAFGTGPQRFGLVHADIRLANLLVEGEATKVIDFDDSGFSWFLYDIGTALSFIEHRPDVPDLVDAWIRGYRKVAPLTVEEEAEIPTFIMMRRLLLVAWIGSHHETNLARGLGVAYTAGTADLADAYLAKFS